MSQILFHASEAFLAVQSHDKSVEVFRVRSEEEIQKKRTRRRKRAKEKQSGSAAAAEDEQEDGTVAPAEIFAPYLVVRASGKIRSFCFSASGKLQVRLRLRDAYICRHADAPRSSLLRSHPMRSKSTISRRRPSPSQLSPKQQDLSR